ncbi:TPA: hypothetical protein HA274_06235 [Candidatus Bathyarchaeota archaeon]|nr:hypothetical protein [Candidatus Bathyarchaeota archaeon]
MLFKHRTTKFHVDMGDLDSEKENLTNFLLVHLKVSVSQGTDKLTVESENLSLQDLEHVVNKFVYHRDLNGTHWVSTEKSTVKINRFKERKKKRRQEKEPPHQTAAQSWGL